MGCSSTFTPASNSRNRTARPLRTRPVHTAFLDAIGTLPSSLFEGWTPATDRNHRFAAKSATSCGKWLRGKMRRQAELREQRRRIQERVPARDAVARQLEDDEGPWLVAPGSTGPVLSEGGRAAGGGRYEAGAAAGRSWPEKPLADRRGPAEAERIRRHGQRRVLMEQRHERVHVVAQERVHVALDQLRLRLRQRLSGIGHIAASERRTRALQRAVHRGDRGDRKSVV